MKGAGGASCQEGQLWAAWNKCFTTAAQRDLVKKVDQKCVCPFVFFCFHDCLAAQRLKSAVAESHPLE